jgi:hypothetical protein
LNQGKKSENQIHQLVYQELGAQHQVERWEEEGMETTLLKKKKIQYRIQWEMKKMDNQFLTSTKQ